MARLGFLFMVGTVLCMVACGGGANNGGGGGLVSPLIGSVTASCNPASVASGATSQCSATVTGTGSFSSAVLWTASSGTITTAGVFTAPQVQSNSSAVITATSAQDVSKSNSTTVSITPPTYVINSISVSCTPDQIRTGKQSQCTATVSGTGTFSQAVTWSAYQGLPGNDCKCIDANGLMTGPVVPGEASFGIVATSVQDPTRTGSAPIYVYSPGTITAVTPSCVKTTINPGQDSLCTAVVTGTGGYSSNVSWQAFTGSINDSGLYFAPSSQASYVGTIMASSVQDPSVWGTTTITVTPATALPNNVAPLTVDGGLVGSGRGYVNGAFTSVTVCVPGTYTCQTIDHILVDTGSSGLRLLASGTAGGQLNLSLPPQLAMDGNPLVECAPFVSGYLWGPSARADVLTLADGTGEQGPDVQIQVVGQMGEPSVPSSCSRSGVDESNLQALGANGLLGVGVNTEDCGRWCFNSFNLPNIYYSCGAAGCSVINAFAQVENPVAHFTQDGNGVVLQLPAVAPPGTTTVQGSLIFGINTQANNNLGDAQVFATDPNGSITTNFQNVDYAGSFLDSGSNGLFLLNAQAFGSMMGTCSDNRGWYCPSSAQTYTATNKGTNRSTGAVTFTIDNADRLFQNSSFFVLPTLGGEWPISPLVFDWGLPFFYGRSVYTAIGGTPIPGTGYFGPFFAY